MGPDHPARRDDEVRAILADASTRVLVRGDPETRPDADVPELDGAEVDALPAAATLPAREVEPDNLVLLAYTSGTTGAPKGVLLNESSVLWSIAQMVAALGLSADDVALAAAPFTRMGGLVVSVLPTFFAGGAVAVPPRHAFSGHRNDRGGRRRRSRIRLDFDFLLLPIVAQQGAEDVRIERHLSADRLPADQVQHP